MIVETVSNSFNNFVDNRGSGGGYFLSIISVIAEAPIFNKFGGCGGSVGGRQI